MEKGKLKTSLRKFLRRGTFELTENLCSIYGIPTGTRMYKVKKNAEREAV